MKILEIKTEERLLGNYGEKMAARHLKKSGYKILERNYVADGHEIDLIASKNDIIAFVEVKTRTIGKENPNEPRPASGVNVKKQQSIIRAAKYYSAYNPSDKRKRLDIVEVYVNQNNSKYSVAEIKHLENAFNINTAFPKWQK